MATLLLHPFHPSQIPFTSKSFILPSQPDNADSAAPATQVQPPVILGFMLPRHNTKSAVRPAVPPGFEPLKPKTDPVVPVSSSVTYNLFGSANRNVAQQYGPIRGGSAMNCHCHQNALAMMNQIQMITKGYEELQKEVTLLKKQSGKQAGLINWLKEDVRCYEESKITISKLEGNVLQLVNRTQEVENSYVNMLFQVESVVDENRKLRGLVGDLREELGQVRRVVKNACVGGAIVGGDCYSGRGSCVDEVRGIL